MIMHSPKILASNDKATSAYASPSGRNSPYFLLSLCICRLLLLAGNLPIFCFPSVYASPFGRKSPYFLLS